jgi:hypothetical protein
MGEKTVLQCNQKRQQEGDSVMANFDKQQMISEFKKQFGFVPPCGMGAADLGEDMQLIKYMDTIYATARRDSEPN